MNIKTLHKNNSLCNNTSHSFIHKNKSYITNKTAHTNAYTHKPVSPQSSIFHSKTKTSSHYHDSFHSSLLLQPSHNQQQQQHSFRQLFLTKSNLNNKNILMKDSSQMSILSLYKGRPLHQQQTSPSFAFGKRKLAKGKSTSPYEYNKNKHKHRASSALSVSQQIKSLFKKGLTKYEYSQIKQYSIDEGKYQRQAFPMVNSKKLVKNILPKEYNFVKEKTPDEVLRHAYHPVVRFQKKLLNKHINNINKEINVDYSHTFTLVKKGNFSERFRMSSNLINLEKDTRLLELIEKFIQSNFKLANEIDNVIEQKRKREEQERKQKLYFKFKRTLIRAAIHFKRLDIKLIDFLNMKNPLHIQPYEHKESYELICAIKDKDIETICRMVRDNYFLVFDFDNVSNIYIHHHVIV